MDFYLLIRRYEEGMAEGLGEIVGQVFASEDYQYKKGFGLQSSPPWYLSEHGGPEDGAWGSVGIHSAPDLLTDKALSWMAEVEGGPADRGAEAFPGDLVAARWSRRQGPVLALAHRESPAMAYAAVFREGRCSWSEYLSPGKVLARADGRGALIRGEPGLEEGDRMRILLRGLEKISLASWTLSEEALLFLPDHLGAFLDEESTHWQPGRSTLLASLSAAP